MEYELDPYYTNVGWYAVTAGFEEPHMLAFIFGNVIKFKHPGKTELNGQFGYMGFLLGVSDYHVKDNALIKDDNIELEWKLKGDKNGGSHQLSWSFRLGIKQHAHLEVRNEADFAIRRSSIDFRENHLPCLRTWDWNIAQVLTRRWGNLKPLPDV